MRVTLRKVLAPITGFFIGCFLIIHTRLQPRSGQVNVVFQKELSQRSARREINLRIHPENNRIHADEKIHSELDDTLAKIPEPKKRPWYMRRGKLRPKRHNRDDSLSNRTATLYPEEKEGDRIEDQLMYFPPGPLVPEDQTSADIPLKKILLWNGGGAWNGIKPGRGVFIKRQCPVSSCAISTSRNDYSKADLVIFKDHFVMPGYSRPKSQLWMMYMLECPIHTQKFNHKDVFNWTATYRSDSTVVTPYERWQYYNDDVRAIPQKKNYAARKTRKVAWFVSNCNAQNNRLEYARNLSNYIDVDIYGKCGKMKCPRNSNACFDRLNNDYKFYLAFENSNCADYITEKFFVNGLGHDVIPIAMGARPEDYKRVSPEKSYIHVEDFDSPQHLAEYLHMLDTNDTAYNEYFQWKGTGEMIDTKFFCRLCTLLHDDKDRQEHSYVHDINAWWRGLGSCINAPWKEFYAAVERDKRRRQKELEAQTTDRNKETTSKRNR